MNVLLHTFMMRVHEALHVADGDILITHNIYIYIYTATNRTCRER